MWVVLLGPDGAGKSSVIARIGDGVAAGFTGCDSYHLRPLTLRRRRRMNCDPHGQPARGVLATVVKLGFLLMLNWLGYLAVVRPRVAGGRLVLFDRYFPDCLVDHKRYRVPASCKWLVEAVARLVPQPDLYVVLDAPAHVLRGRKQELTPTEMERQRAEYRRLAASTENAAVVSVEAAPATTQERVVQCIIEWRLARKQRLLEAV